MRCGALFGLSETLVGCLVDRFAGALGFVAGRGAERPASGFP